MEKDVPEESLSAEREEEDEGTGEGGSDSEERQDPLSKGIVTLSSLPQSHWASLPHLELIKVCVKLLPSGLARLIIPIANGSPIEVTHAFRRVKFNLLVQNRYCQLKLWLYFETKEL